MMQSKKDGVDRRSQTQVRPLVPYATMTQVLTWLLYLTHVGRLVYVGMMASLE